MNTYNTALEQQADLLVEEALHELGATLLNELDEYAAQCDYAGCYPWLEDVICAHPHEHPAHPTPFDDTADQDPDSCC